MIDVEISYEPKIIEYAQLQQLYGLQLAYVMRKKIHFSIVLIEYKEEFPISYHKFYEQLKEQLRNSDFAFMQSENQYIVLLLTISKIAEAKSFIQRIQGVFARINIPIVSVISEVANDVHSLDEVLAISESALLYHEHKGHEPVVINDFLERSKVVIKVSIIENDRITQSIFTNLFQHISLDNVQLDIQTFSDGLQFIESDFYRSGHNHIVVLNDILPKKNGLEVLDYLRSLPNEQKYIILFCSSRVSEDAQLYCFEHGADAYIVRPFNLRIVEKQIKNYLRRLY
ncbi:response regulator transcription factor [Solibacillus daqui]|uniref:response regulator transcription factor n=1 Tax=Solibacillus daqui TaxID=2912187 RepID=UPI0023654EF5|nr:response regulator [Solibacillus daqui]